MYAFMVQTSGSWRNCWIQEQENNEVPMAGFLKETKLCITNRKLVYPLGKPSVLHLILHVLYGSQSYLSKVECS